jgi:hypothetical protein
VSLRRSGASKKDVQHILDVVRDELYQGISTREIYNRAFGLLKKKQPVFASKYKLKKAIYELGPTGFPFEEYVAELFKAKFGYKTLTGQVVLGGCVPHEIDVVGWNDEKLIMAEVKYHSDAASKTDLKVALYVLARFEDISETDFDEFSSISIKISD